LRNGKGRSFAGYGKESECCSKCKRKLLKKFREKITRSYTHFKMIIENVM
jgi:hypothetical protein